jgi:branched-chain amino acid aminotransferase
MSEGQQPFIWLNGALLRASAARIDPSDRGMLLGDGVYETLRVADGVPQVASRHLSRLRYGAATLGIAVPLEDAEILAAFAETLAANRLTRQAVLRLTLTRGPAPRGLALPADPRPTLLITAAAFTTPPAMITAVICRSTRRNEFSPLAGIKSLNVLDNILAKREAEMRGGEDAILLNTQGYVAEASAANVFLLKDGAWLTPRLQDGALPGIFRGLVLASHAASEAQITEADLFGAQTVCLGNALGVRAVSRLDGRDIEFQPEAIATLYQLA